MWCGFSIPNRIKCWFCSDWVDIKAPIGAKKYQHIQRFWPKETISRSTVGILNITFLTIPLFSFCMQPIYRSHLLFSLFKNSPVSCLWDHQSNQQYLSSLHYACFLLVLSLSTTSNEIVIFPSRSLPQMCECCSSVLSLRLFGQCLYIYIVVATLMDPFLYGVNTLGPLCLWQCFFYFNFHFH